MIVQNESKNRNVRKLGIVTDLRKGKDGVVGGAKVKTTNGNIKRAIQHLYPFELICDDSQFRNPNPQHPSFSHDS